jgi:hypothetical protein
MPKAFRSLDAVLRRGMISKVSFPPDTFGHGMDFGCL